MRKLICWLMKKFPCANYFYTLCGTTTEKEYLHYAQMYYHPNAPTNYYEPDCNISTEKEINKVFDWFDRLDYPLKYWLFERFVDQNLHQLDYFMALLNYKKEEINHDDGNK